MMEQWHPLGPIGVITAFNFPMAVWAWNAMIALVCGAPFLVSWYGAKGLAGMMVLAEAILLTVLASRLAAVGNLPRLIRPALGILAACGAAYTVGLLGVEWPLLPRVAATLFVGLFGLWVFRAVRGADIQFVMELVRKKRPPDAGAQ